MDKLKRILLGMAISTVISIILLIVFSLILVKSDISENCIDSAIIIITGVSIFIGTFFSNMKLKKSGILNGLLASAIYIGILYILSSAINNDYTITQNSIYMIITGIVLGVIGGIVGVNIKK